MKQAGFARLHGVSVVHGTDTVALGTTDLSLPPGSFTSLVGPSGCGKSTLLNVLAGFVTPTTGRAFLDDTPLEGPSPQRGVVFQNYALYPWLTARGNVDLALRRHLTRRSDRRDQAVQNLAAVGIDDREAERYPAELSGGMQQRVALARTLAAEPDLLLMDEPFGALDATTRHVMQQLLLDVWEARRTTVLFVTHDIDEALYLSDRVVVMNGKPGTITQTFDLTTSRPRDISRFTEEQSLVREQIFHLIHDVH